MYILLYSKYSRSCMKILDSVDQLNSMTGNSIPMVQLVCIDNKETRKQILNSNSIEIKKVPCLLVVDNTTVEKYDGERAFEWVSEVIQKISVKSQPNSKPPSPPPKTMIQIEVPPKPQSTPPKPQSRPPKPQSTPPKPQSRPPKPKTKKKAETKIEDLDDIEEEEDEETENQDKPKKPPIPNRNESGSYIIDGSSEEDQEEKEDNQEKKSTNSSKGMGILDIAFAMRQEREKGK
jgi:hypothetical protein